ncbi:PREDICTED: uncharacterized protein LOC101291859 [Fragaria vesca subsp. vesca]
MCQFIPQSRVPILLVKSKLNDISCDISVNNLKAQMKSKLLLWINDIDPHFHDMVLLVKEWAKAHNINNSKFGTFNSYSLSLLVVFHFQTCAPAILPPLPRHISRNSSRMIFKVNSIGIKVLEFCSHFRKPTAPLPAAIVACVPKKLEVPKELISSLQLQDLRQERMPSFITCSPETSMTKIYDKETGITRARLSNGISVNYKISKSEARGGLMRLIVGGGCATESSESKGSVVVGVRTLSEAGRVGNFSREQVCSLLEFDL